jgi:hypothetical protein
LIHAVHLINRGDTPEATTGKIYCFHINQEQYQESS